MDNEYTREQLETMEEIEGLSALLRKTIVEHVPDCKERDLALSKVEECSMWVNKGISNNRWFYDLHEGFKKNRL